MNCLRGVLDQVTDKTFSIPISPIMTVKEICTTVQMLFALKSPIEAYNMGVKLDGTIPAAKQITAADTVVFKSPVNKHTYYSQALTTQPTKNYIFGTNQEVKQPPTEAFYTYYVIDYKNAPEPNPTNFSHVYNPGILTKDNISFYTNDVSEAQTKVANQLNFPGYKALIYLPCGIPLKKDTISMSLNDEFFSGKKRSLYFIFVKQRPDDDVIDQPIPTSIPNISNDQNSIAALNPFMLDLKPKDLSTLSCLIAFLRYNPAHAAHLAYVLAKLIPFAPMIMAIHRIMDSTFPITYRNIIEFAAPLTAFGLSHNKKPADVWELISGILPFRLLTPLPSVVYAKPFTSSQQFLATLGETTKDCRIPLYQPDILWTTWFPFVITKPLPVNLNSSISPQHVSLLRTTSSPIIFNMNNDLRCLSSFVMPAEVDNEQRVANEQEVDHEKEDGKGTKEMGIYNPHSGSAERVSVTELAKTAREVNPDVVKELIYIIIDLSGSMTKMIGKTNVKRVDLANQCVKIFTKLSQAFRTYNLYGIMTFSSELIFRCPPPAADNICTGFSLVPHCDQFKVGKSVRTHLYEAINKASDIIKQHAPNYPNSKRRIIAISDGADQQTDKAAVKHTLTMSASFLRDNDIVFDSFFIGEPDEETDGQRALRALSKLTGGLAFNPSKVAKAKAIFEEEGIFDCTIRQFDPPINYQGMTEDQILALGDYNFAEKPTYIDLRVDASNVATPRKAVIDGLANPPNQSHTMAIMKQLQHLTATEIDYCVVLPNNDNIAEWHVWIQSMKWQRPNKPNEPPQDAPYTPADLQDNQNVWWQLHITFPTLYPVEPPVVRFVTIPVHPNIHSTTGLICLPILTTSYSIRTSMRMILSQIVALLSTPNFNSPIQSSYWKQIIMNNKPQTDPGYMPIFTRATLKKFKETAIILSDDTKPPVGINVQDKEDDLLDFSQFEEPDEQLICPFSNEFMRKPVQLTLGGKIHAGVWYELDSITEYLKICKANNIVPTCPRTGTRLVNPVIGPIDKNHLDLIQNYQNAH